MMTPAASGAGQKVTVAEILLYLNGPIGSGLLGGITVAFLTWLFGRSRTAAEIKKMGFEAEKFRAEATKIQEESARFALENKQTREQMARTQAALESVSSRFFNDEDYTLYDGSAGMDLSHFRAFESNFYGDPPNTRVGHGSLRIIDKAFSLTRFNTEGRYRLILTQYRYNGDTIDHLPKNPMIAGDRRIRLRFDAKVTEGSHVLALCLKYGHLGGFEERITRAVAEKQWEAFEVVLRSKPDMQASLYIDDQDVSVAGSSIQIRNLIVSEIRSGPRR